MITREISAPPPVQPVRRPAGDRERVEEERRRRGRPAPSPATQDAPADPEHVDTYV